MALPPLARARVKSNGSGENHFFGAIGARPRFEVKYFKLRFSSKF